MIFVFGSNLNGHHGKGAARTALLQHGAVYGQAEGIMGWSSYALPTCNYNLKPLSLDAIAHHITRFADFVKKHPELKFQVTRVGCGLAGHKDKDIAPMFEGAPENVFFDEQWRPYLGEKHAYWGTY